MKRLRVTLRSVPWLGHLLRSEEGAASIPAVFWMPFFVMMMVASVEMCILGIRQTLLDRGVDLTTRILRLGVAAMPSHDQLKRSICGNIAFLPDCMQDLTVEVFQVDRTTWSSDLNGRGVLCADSITETNKPVIQPGVSGQLMILRACLRVSPMETLNPLSQALTHDIGGDYALITTTAFVNEPQ
ncbi:hypothetical protein PUH89_16435 [Rhodobacter capsulatus]|uniref:Pilus assembly protein n=1 Tax=Rhodobacter capsulatus TaxID=1061 RepID=A0A1G7CBF8_RHOCA|nr:hypothetical protein [Rhodobacter capsulatus]WER08875.1 hypothetical protein PUH89_16435 [Rhodobacter capsulatus]SDE36704.1 hypothetical protein SAMN04244550_00223 [Rhodobacter capsulatus]